MSPARSGLGFAKSLRLLSAAQYQPVFNQAEVRAAQPQILILARSNGLDHPRLGLVVGKKHARRACDRNRIKRMARETFRLAQHQLPPLDAIVLARSGAAQLDNAELGRLFNKLWRKLANRTRQAQGETR